MWLKWQFAFRHGLNDSNSHPSAQCLGIADASALCLGGFSLFLASLIFRILATQELQRKARNNPVSSQIKLA